MQEGLGFDKNVERIILTHLPVTCKQVSDPSKRVLIFHLRLVCKKWKMLFESGAFDAYVDYVQYLKWKAPNVNEYLADNDICIPDRDKCSFAELMRCGQTYQAVRLKTECYDESDKTGDAVDLIMEPFQGAVLSLSTCARNEWVTRLEVNLSGDLPNDPDGDACNGCDDCEYDQEFHYSRAKQISPDFMANLSMAFVEVQRIFLAQQRARNELQHSLQKKRSRIQEIEDLIEPPEERKRRAKAACERALESDDDDE
jgi:hypothetical protein